MADHREMQRSVFHEQYHSDWKLRTFDAPVWIVEYEFDDSGPSEFEFETIVRFVADDLGLGLTRDELKDRLDGCSGFTLGRPHSSSEVQALRESGVRISPTRIEPGNCLIYTHDKRYFLVEDAKLREELAAWMIAKGNDIESLSIE
jgi:hypothetical protein